ncbi:hypothetical protein E1293_44015 [Actinomadura darangshiensis]|uniref:Uncharacterized protein n=1 Tax=Actinomadura darangshiensis TaxID=705336 RepID=A0A4R4ZWE2_9ACTN|nr:hypothetical protein [Actinomadura darangshiensis]TDD62584.1 hypothetical protein E1293_44015 [Actinomadura darangshiensis]
MRLGRLPDGFGLGLYVSAFAALLVVPAGIALRSWELPALVLLAIMIVCVAGTWLVHRGEGSRITVMVVAWCAGAALGAGLIAFGVYAIVSFEPHCVSGPAFTCFDTVAEQRASNFWSALLLPIGGGTILLAVLLTIAVRTALKARRDR